MSVASLDMLCCNNESGTGFGSRWRSGDVVDSREKRASSEAFRCNRLFNS